MIYGHKLDFQSKVVRMFLFGRGIGMYLRLHKNAKLEESVKHLIMVKIRKDVADKRVEKLLVS